MDAFLLFMVFLTGLLLGASAAFYYVLHLLDKNFK